MLLETIFRDDSARANFIQLLIQAFDCTYICFWSFLPQPANGYFFFLDGHYREENDQPSSSSGSQARRLFDEYKNTPIVLENDHVPGLAFKSSFPYLELQEIELRRLASNETQRNFYQEARIKAAVFMACKGAGEIEFGFSNEPLINTKMEIRNLFLGEFPTQTQLEFPGQTQLAELPRPVTDQNPLSSSSSSLRSLSTMDSPECSSLLFNIPTPTTSQIPENQPDIMTSPLRPISAASLPSTANTIFPHQQAMQAFARIRNPQFPSQETEEAAMTKAILAVLSSPSSSSSSLLSSQTAPPTASPYSHFLNPKSSAFKLYSSTSRLALSTSTSSRLGRPSIFKRSISFFRRLNFRMSHHQQRFQGTRPSTNQLHHMISERKRREKLNESFVALRSLLPPGTKKDKASVLTTTKDYLTSLKSQVAELSRRNQQLEAKVLAGKEADSEEASELPSGERVGVAITHVTAESTSEEAQVIDLRVILRSAVSAEDLVLRILEFLKQLNNVSLVSLEANNHQIQATSINRLTLRLRVEGSEWDESAFQEAVRRVVADLAQ
ncbi:hypothetical protein UlMin_022062 [Ulmus minor]